MFIAKLKIGQSVRVGDVVITATKHQSGRKIKLVFDAPPDVRIVRGEVEGNLTLQQHLTLLSADL